MEVSEVESESSPGLKQASTRLVIDLFSLFCHSMTNSRTTNLF